VSKLARFMTDELARPMTLVGASGAPLGDYPEPMDEATKQQWMELCAGLRCAIARRN